MSVKITEADCAQILSKYFKGKPPNVTSFSLAPVSDEVGNGFMGNHLLLRINFENRELRFFAKTSPSEADPTAAFIRQGNMFNKEVYCYKFLEKVKNEFPEFEASFVPQYYFSKDDEVLILEDLASSGYESWSGEELDLNHIKLGISALAKLHTASFLFEEIKSQELGRKYFLLEDYSKWLEENIYSEDEDYDGYKYMQTGVKALCALTEVVDKNFLTSSDFKQKIRLLARETYNKIKPSQKFRNVWCHGDVWIKNMMFKYQNGVPVDCKIFDFQMTRYNPPVHDILFMLYENVSIKWRQQHFHNMLNFYYLTLKCELEKHYYQIKNILSKDELELSARELFSVNKLSKSIYKTISGMSSETLEEVMSDPKFYYEFNYINRDEFVLKIFQKEEQFRKLMTSMLQDIEDVLVFEKVTIEECFKIVNKALGTTHYQIINTKITHFNDTLSKFEIQICRGSQSEILSFLIKDIIPSEKFLLNDTSNEVDFYKMITSSVNESNLIKHCVPRCFLYRANDVLVYHDYYTKGYKTLTSTLDDYKAVKVVMKKLAQFHAGGFILKQKHQQNECFNLDDVESVKYVIRECLIQQGKSKVKLELFDNYISKILEEATKYAKTSLTHRSVCHGNLLSENILFRFDNNEAPVKCIFTNFENYHRGPLAFDFLLFFHLSTSRKFRHQYMKEFLDMYYGEMTTTLKIYNIKVEDVLPLEKFLEDFTKLKPLAISRSLLYYYNIVMFAKEDNKLFLKKQLNDDSSDSVHRLQECVADIKSLCKG